MKIRLMTSNGIPEALSNLWWKNECDVSTFEDAIEDAKSTDEMLKNLNSLRLFSKFTFCRETEARIKFKTVDAFGNTHYLTVTK